MTEIDFAALNKTLRERAAARQHSSRPPENFYGFFLSRTTEQYLDEADSFKDIDYYFDLNDKGLKLLFKKFIRKINKFLFLKNTDQQRHFNSALLTANFVLSKRINSLQQQLDLLQRQCEQCLHVPGKNEPAATEREW